LDLVAERNNENMLFTQNTRSLWYHSQAGTRFRLRVLSKIDSLNLDSVTCAVRRTRTTYTATGVLVVAGPRVWNSLPTELRQSDSLGQFKRRLKTRLFG